MIHSVGCPQPKAQVFADSWNQAGKEIAVHAVLEPGKIIQCLPWNFRGWHGGGDSNNTHVGVEMTEPATIKYTGGASWVETSDGTNTKAHVLGTYKTAVELFAFLCGQYKLDPLKDGVIISHSEGYKRGIASNHGDVEHLWNKFGLTMKQFRQDIKAAMTSGTGDNPSVWAKEATTWAKGIKLFEGDGAGNYDWQGVLTREMAAQVFYNYSKIIK